MKPLKMLVVTSCTGEKAYKPKNQLTLEDFSQGEDHLKQREAELTPVQMSAGMMYTGAQHANLMEGVAHYRNKCPDHTLDVQIISAGYGLIDEHQTIAPYEVTFNTMKVREARAWGEKLQIHQDLNQVIQHYHMVFFLLGENYLKVAKLPLDTREDQTLVFLASKSTAREIPVHAARQVVVPLSNPDARTFRYGLVGLKGFLFKHMARELALHPHLAGDWHQDPQKVIAFLESFRQTQQAPQAALLEPPRHIGGSENAFHRLHSFNPMRLSSEEFHPQPQHPPGDSKDTRFTVVINNRDRLRVKGVDHRIWHYLEQKPRGFLTSLAYHKPDGEPLPEVKEGNIYDCGAWSYKNEPYPILKKKDGPLTAQKALEMFIACQVKPQDILVSPDMLILGNETEQVKQDKIDLTLKTAREFKEITSGMRAMAVTHGSFEERHQMMEQYLEMGYRHIALGSLAIKSAQNPTFVYQCVEDALKWREQVPDLYIHVLGVSSILWAATLTRMKVSSFDGSSMYMSAFTGGLFMQYDPNHPSLLRTHRIVDNPPFRADAENIPPCNCPACKTMRDENWDTRAQGGKVNDPSGRPYNGGNEANMGRAVHNINMYMRALQDVQARLRIDENDLLIQRHLPKDRGELVKLI